MAHSRWYWDFLGSSKTKLEMFIYSVLYYRHCVLQPGSSLSPRSPSLVNLSLLCYPYAFRLYISPINTAEAIYYTSDHPGETLVFVSRLGKGMNRSSSSAPLDTVEPCNGLRPPSSTMLSMAAPVKLPSACELFSLPLSISRLSIKPL